MWEGRILWKLLQAGAKLGTNWISGWVHKENREELHRENEAVHEVGEVLSNFQPVFVDVSECELRSTDQSMLSLTFIWDQSFTRDPSFVFTYYANPRRETKDLMNFKVTKKAKSFIGNIFKLLKKFRKNCTGQWHYCPLLCWAALWSPAPLTVSCHTHITDNFSCFRYIGHGHVFHSPLLFWYLVLPLDYY